jgi:hypothetical protein
MRQSLRELEAKTTALAKQVAALMISADEEPMGTAA